MQGETFCTLLTLTSTRINKQATFRVIAINGKDRHGHNELFIFATNTDISPRKIRKIFRKRWMEDRDFIQDDKQLPSQDHIKDLFS